MVVLPHPPRTSEIHVLLAEVGKGGVNFQQQLATRLADNPGLRNAPMPAVAAAR